MARVEGAASLSGHIGLFRLGNCLMGAFGALLAAVICAGADGVQDYAFEIACSMAVVVAFTAAGNSLNDYFDREVDRTAHPERPIPSGRVKPTNALALSALLFSAAIILSVLVGIWSLLIVLTSVIIIVGYEKYLKAEGFVGNLSISWLTGALFLFGGAAVEVMDLAWILAALAFLATLGREIVKDVQDMEGDRGSRLTLPMRMGAKRAGIVGSSAFLAAVGLSPAPYLLGLLSEYYVPAVLLADAIFIYCATIHFRSPERGQKVAKLAMFVALLAFLLGGVF